jgi:hypothetical protein
VIFKTRITSSQARGLFKEKSWIDISRDYHSYRCEEGIILVFEAARQTQTQIRFPAVKQGLILE